MKAVFIHGAGDIRIGEIPACELGPRDVEVGVKVAGICGSDLHYYLHGGFGPVRLKEPLILGHEFAGEVLRVGPEVSDIQPGVRVAVNPSQACGDCHYCLRAEYRHCQDMRFFGSAMRFPHVQGGFRESIAVPANQIVPISDSVSYEEAALAEPLAVCLHAAHRGRLAMGQRVLVTGCGPIGVLCIAIAKLAGAKEIIATDVNDFPLEIARQMGADQALNVATNPESLHRYNGNKGLVDLMFEASANESAIAAGIDAVKPCGTIVQLGLAGNLPVPINALVAKEIEFLGTFRFDHEFAEAVGLINCRTIDLSPLLTSVLDFQKSSEAFEFAKNRSKAMKVQLSFGS